MTFKKKPVILHPVFQDFGGAEKKATDFFKKILKAKKIKTWNLKKFFRKCFGNK